MSSLNPYTSPATDGPVTDRLLIRNLNQAGGPLAMALIVNPLLLCLFVWGIARADVSDMPLVGKIVILTLQVGGQVAWFVYGLKVPVLWVEIGPTLRYGTLASTHEVAWSDLQRIWFEREDEHVRFGLFFLTLAAHHALIIQINDYKDLRVLVPGEKLELVHAILSSHPNYKDSPYDEEPPELGDELEAEVLDEPK